MTLFLLPVSGYHAAFLMQFICPMRPLLLATLLLSFLLSACATKDDISLSKHIPQNGPLKVAPGLLGQPVPAELRQQTPTPAANAPSADSKAKADAVAKPD